MTGRQFVVEVSDPFGNVFGRVNNPFDRHFNFVLNGMSTAAFRVPTSDAMARYVAGDALIKIYYGADIVFHGPVTSWERVHEGGKHSIAVTAADPFIYLTKRYLNKTTADVTYANIDRGMLTATFIDQLNAESPTGIRTGAQVSYSESDVTYVVPPWKPMTETIKELSPGPNGFNWRVMPTEMLDDGAIADWYAEPVAGRHLEDDVIFESGGGLSNVSEAHEQGDFTTTANRVYVLASSGAGTPNVMPVESDDYASQDLRRLQESVVTTDVTDTPLRQDLADEHIAVRSGARRVVSFTPSRYDATAPGRTPVFGITADYDVGDFVRAKAQDETGVWLDSSVRIWAVSVSPDDHGVDSIALTLAEEE
jgi:hypothetical protein